MGLQIIIRASVRDHNKAHTHKNRELEVKKIASEFTCLKVISLEQEQEKKNMDPHPNHSADFVTFLHISSSTVLSQRPSHPDCSTKSVPAPLNRNNCNERLSEFEIRTLRVQNSQQ
jgi:hypothetical protein